jgi:FkbH-like protein
VQPQAAAPTVVATAPYPDDAKFRTPLSLAVKELPVRNILVIGSCLSGPVPLYMDRAFPTSKRDHILFNNAATLPEEPPSPLESYDFQLVMPSLREVIPERLYFGLSYSDLAGHQQAFDVARERLLQMLHGMLAYRTRRQLTTFVTNYMTQQQNAVGRLMPRYDLRNPIYFVEQLNRVIADEIADMPDVYLVDLDQIAANFGRRYIQDDVTAPGNHHSYASNVDHPYDQGRLKVPPKLSEMLPLRVPEFIVAIGYEVRALYRTIRQADQVKLIILDLDDTLWRGVVAEEGIDRPLVTEGWPIGFVEALVYAKKRGILLAIVSKNDEQRIRELWPRLYGGRLDLGDFASVQINWRSKSENVVQVLEDTNLLSKNVLFVDDNPVERSNVAEAFPDIRVIGDNPYELRRLILWSPELQVAQITNESIRRTEMVRAQVEREATRKRMSREEFLTSLDVRIAMFAIADVLDARFARSLELVNKSNQFNTTGERWTLEQVQKAFDTGMVMWALEVEDRFTDYGNVGVAIVQQGSIAQFVMSCRVIGLDVEVAVISELVGRRGISRADYRATEANALCRDLYERCGFTTDGDGWACTSDSVRSRPPHVRDLRVEGLLIFAEK